MHGPGMELDQSTLNLFFALVSGQCLLNKKKMIILIFVSYPKYYIPSTIIGYNTFISIHNTFSHHPYKNATT